jgi:hypothetical protein
VGSLVDVVPVEFFFLGFLGVFDLAEFDVGLGGTEMVVDDLFDDYFFQGSEVVTQESLAELLDAVEYRFVFDGVFEYEI